MIYAVCLPKVTWTRQVQKEDVDKHLSTFDDFADDLNTRTNKSCWSICDLSFPRDIGYIDRCDVAFYANYWNKWQTTINYGLGNAVLRVLDSVTHNIKLRTRRTFYLHLRMQRRSRRRRRVIHKYEMSGTLVGSVDVVVMCHNVPGALRSDGLLMRAESPHQTT